MMDTDGLFAIFRKPHRIIIFCVDSEIRSVCYPSYSRMNRLIFEQGGCGKMVDFKKLMEKPEMTDAEREELWKPWKEAHAEDIKKLNKRMGEE